MNIGIVRYFLGWVSNIKAFLMLPPCVTAVAYQDHTGIYFLTVMTMYRFLGWLAVHRKPKNTVFHTREGFVTVALSWVLLSFFGALPLWISGEIPSLVDVVSETISGFTATGVSVSNNMEGLSQFMLMWRSFTHWVGGMDVLVFLLAILPLVGGGYSMHIMRTESPGSLVGKLVPKMKAIAKLLYLIYFSMTVIEVILLLVRKMPFFDALTTGFGTTGTGGSGIKNSSIVFYDSYYLRGVITISMILLRINFNVYYLFLLERPKEALKSEEARTYLGIILVPTLLIAQNVRSFFPTLFDAFHRMAFQVASAIATTGFSTVDPDVWPQSSKTILIWLMSIGAYAGSTGGGMKVPRLIIWIRETLKELTSLIHPRSVKVMKLEGKSIEHNIVRSVNAYLIVYILIFTSSVLLVNLDEFDFNTTFTAVVATFNNIGPGMGGVGPASNFSEFSAMPRLVLMFDMLAGCLETFPMLLLFSPGTRRKQQRNCSLQHGRDNRRPCRMAG